MKSRFCWHFFKSSTKITLLSRLVCPFFGKGQINLVNNCFNLLSRIILKLGWCRRENLFQYHATLTLFLLLFFKQVNNGSQCLTIYGSPSPYLDNFTYIFWWNGKKLRQKRLQVMPIWRVLGLISIQFLEYALHFV